MKAFSAVLPERLPGKRAAAVAGGAGIWRAPLLLAILWVAAWWQMSADWWYDDSYRYGWLVPFLSAYLIWKRGEAGSVPGVGGSGGKKRTPLWLTGGYLLPAVCYIPLGVVRAANPDWRLIGIAMALLALTATWTWLWQAGGRSAWQTFAVATGFALVGTPWPTGLERWAADTLMPANASLALEGLQWLGAGASRMGNVILLPAGKLGVDEACSGIRSLQATLMLGLFLGEWNRLAWTRRLLLVAGGVLLALVTNACRTIALAVLAGTEGMAAADRAHDAAGLGALAVNAAVLLWLGRKTSPPKPSEASPAPPVFLSPGAWRGPAFCLVGLALAPLAVAGWYGRQEAVSPDLLPSLQPPPTAAGFTPVPISRRVEGMLRFSEGWHTAWNPGFVSHAEAFFFKWKAGTLPPGHFAMHRPENCLTANGLVFGQELSPMELENRGILWRFRVLEFHDGGVPVHVLHGLVRSTPGGRDKPNIWSNAQLSMESRLAAAWQGLRNPIHMLLEIGIRGKATEAEIRQGTLDFLRQCRTGA